KAEALHEKEQAERQKDEALHKQAEAERQKDEERHQKAEAIRLLLQLGVSKAEIAQKLGLSEEDITSL
ncbi:MAG: hypothetical protein ACOYOD_15260, partial [Saprospiraceae bacterium]